jgi:predicted TIM-barrel fold metal-dependent hydrolase
MRSDLNVYLGRWPFRRLRHAGASGVRQLMARTEVVHALAIPLQAVFYKNCLDGVLEMVEDIASEGGPDRSGLLPLAVVNPSFPGWERDLRNMVEDLGCVACGVFPNYHGYRVYDRCAQDLFCALTESGLPALVFVRLWDERSHHWCMQVPPLLVADLTYLLKTYPDVPVAVCNANLPSEGAALAPCFADRAQVLLTTAYKSLKLEQVVERIGAEHIAYASGAPLYYPESALLQVLDAELDKRSRALILGQNARSFLGLQERVQC